MWFSSTTCSVTLLTLLHLLRVALQRLVWHHIIPLRHWLPAALWKLHGSTCCTPRPPRRPLTHPN
jgi:hypothetical protein